MIETQSTFSAGGTTYAVHDVRAAIGADAYARLPYVARVLAENLLRNLGQPGVTEDVLRALVDPCVAPDAVALPLRVPRVIVPDSSGIPVLMDLAALRAAVVRRGGDPGRVNAKVPMTLVVDHSLQVDVAASPDAEEANLRRELERNGERYRFLKWAAQAFDGLTVFAPGSGIIHQIHLEQIAQVTLVDRSRVPHVAFPDFTIAGDSHTPMVNALGVLGWGVGGIEIEAVVLGEPYIVPKPEFVGVRLEGALAGGITVTDVALTLTEQLRAAGVVGACVEFFGPGAPALTVPDRATLANMAPEYGATTGFWPVDEQTIAYLRLTGRSAEHVALVEAHARAAGLFRHSGAADPTYDRVIAFELDKVRRTIAGPGMPHIRQDTSGVAASFRERAGTAAMATPRVSEELPHGAIGIAAITSCTNTSNPHGMIRAGLLAKAAVARGLQSAPWVKTSLAPGSRAVTGYLDRAGLLAPLEALGFAVVGYGCTTCAGKSGPLKPVAANAVERQGRTIAAVLSGNRNFDGRIHRLVGANYLCSPALVVAFALAGRVTIDIARDPIANDPHGAAVFLRDIWPDDSEVDAVVGRTVTPDVFVSTAEASPLVKAAWEALEAKRGLLFQWDADSTYIVEPPFFANDDSGFATAPHIEGVRVLGVYDDNLNTDHASPGGEIPADSPAGQYLRSLGVKPGAFNTYVGRRGNHHVMMRGTYGNVRIRNRIAEGREGWWTKIYPEDEIITIPDAAARYRARKVPLIVIGGRNFGAGSSRDWAAKGPALLGVRAVIARSFERIHRSNLIGVGVVPLLFAEQDSVEALKLDGSEEFAFNGLGEGIAGKRPIGVTARRPCGEEIRFAVTADIRSAAEAELLQRGGMFQAALEASLT
ncbi:MAG TPA: aconitate hydratase AcnA [Xanthobacteraceae bacterium]|nr:aconitate hydratase AcnA [Xanthobacteraceae bacterium]